MAATREGKSDLLLGALRFLVMAIIGLCCFAIVCLLLGAPLVIAFQGDVMALLTIGAESGGQFGVAIVLLMLGIAALLGLVICFFYLLMKITDTVRDGDPFVPENARRLGRMGWVAIAAHAWGLVVTIPGAWMASMVSDPQANDAVEVRLGGSVVLILVLFILARVFRHGAAMREDLEATV